MARPGASAAVSVERFFQLSILGLVTSGYLAVAASGYLDRPTVWLTAAGLLFRAVTSLGIVRFQIPDRLITAITLLYIGFYPLDYLFVSGGFLEATVHLIFFLAVIKILTARTNRDYLYTATIAFLELLAAAILSINLTFFLFLALYVLFAIAAFTSSEIRRSIEKNHAKIARSGLRRFHPRLAGLTLLISVGILSLTAGLFFLLPRTADAAFRHLVSQRYYLPGFSNQVTLGQIGEIKGNSRAVMHVRLYNRVPAVTWKWRGATLSEFDGRRWSNPLAAGQLVRLKDGRAQLVDDLQRRRAGTRLVYRVDLNAIDSDALFVAGIPEFLNVTAPAIIRAPGDSYRLTFIPSQGVRYEVWSFIGEPATDGFEQAAVLRGPYLQLPPIDPRIAELARKITLGQNSDEGRTRALEYYLRRNYGYTLELLSRDVPDPLADFLFERKKGHCEYFASAMTVMLRSLGIPARLVNGFQGGTLNPVSDLYIIRASDAHSWVEAYIRGRGWTTFDPTPPDSSPRAASLWSRLGFYLDAAETFWQEWVLSYDLSRQVELAGRMERSSTRFGLRWLDIFTDASSVQWRDTAKSVLAGYGAWFVGLLTLILAVVLAGPRAWRLLQMHHRVRRVRRGQASVADATLLYGRMEEVLRKRGYQRPPWLTPQEFSRLLPSEPMTEVVAKFTSAYNDLRFGGKLDAAPQLSILLDQLERQEI